jgi:hypothetical protein
VKFEYLSRDLWPTAVALARHFTGRRYTVYAERQIGEAYGFRPTLTCKRSWDLIAVEVSSSPTIEGAIGDFIRTALAIRQELTIYIALPRDRDGEEILLPVSFLDGLRKFGVGLLLVSNDVVEEREKGARCSLRYSVPPGRSLGRYKEQVLEAVKKFNRGDNIDGIRDLTEIVEGGLGELALKASTKRLIIPTPEEIGEMDFEGRINVLGAPEWRNQPQRRFLDENLKNDLRSFRGARNLGHHPRTKKQQKSLENQLMERTQASIRLLREILTQTDRCNRTQAQQQPRTT